MTIEIQLFAAARTLAGTSVLSLSLPEQATVADLRQQLVLTCPALQPLQNRLHVAINNEYAQNSDPVPAGAEVACFPPVSGG